MRAAAFETRGALLVGGAARAYSRPKCGGDLKRNVGGASRCTVAAKPRNWRQPTLTTLSGAGFEKRRPSLSPPCETSAICSVHKRRRRLRRASRRQSLLRIAADDALRQTIFASLASEFFALGTHQFSGRSARLFCVVCSSCRRRRPRRAFWLERAESFASTCARSAKRVATAARANS